MAVCADLADVPSPIDLRLMADAREWEGTAMEKRPWRLEFFAAFGDELEQREPPVLRVLELGSGPGFLASHLLSTLPHLQIVLLDFSVAMHDLARQRLGATADRVEFVTASFKEPEWINGLCDFDAVVTNQAVHELRHKRHAAELHKQVKAVIQPGGSYLVCDHFHGHGAMADDRLYMSVHEQRMAIDLAGYTSVRQILVKGGMVLHHAR